MDTKNIILLYEQLIDAWNQRNARVFADLFTEQGNVIGFDGSQLNGREGIAAELEKIFSTHETASFITIVREVRALNSSTVMLRAVAGMPKRGENVVEPTVNAVQTMVASLQDGEWKIELFQNTPAQLHGRPQEVAKLTDELNEKLQQNYKSS